jgi:hypothetical protein
MRSSWVVRDDCYKSKEITCWVQIQLKNQFWKNFRPCVYYNTNINTEFDLVFLGLVVGLLVDIFLWEWVSINNIPFFGEFSPLRLKPSTQLPSNFPINRLYFLMPLKCIQNYWTTEILTFLTLRCNQTRFFTASFPFLTFFKVPIP